MERSTLIIIIIVGIFSSIGIIAGAFGLREWKRSVDGWEDIYQARKEYDDCLLLGWGSAMCLALSSFAFLIDMYLLFTKLF